MDERLGSLARFERVKAVEQVDHLRIYWAWYLGPDTLPVMVEYKKALGVVELFPDQVGSDTTDMPQGVVRLTGEEFLSVLVWLIRRGLLEDVGLVSTETVGARNAALRTASPVQEDGVEDDDEIDMEWEGYFYERERTETSTERSDTPRLVTMVADEASADSAVSVEEEGEPEDPFYEFDEDLDLSEGGLNPGWLESKTVMGHLHHDLELSASDIAKLCGTTYARVKGALKRLGIEQRSYRGGRSKIGPRRDSGSTGR